MSLNMSAVKTPDCVFDTAFICQSGKLWCLNDIERYDHVDIISALLGKSVVSEGELSSFISEYGWIRTIPDYNISRFQISGAVNDQQVNAIKSIVGSMAQNGSIEIEINGKFFTTERNEILQTDNFPTR